VAPLLAEIVRYMPYLRVLPLIAAAAALLGATFPLICHISVAPDRDTGARLSYLYLANIIGSALGSYLVGFVLMDYFHLHEIAIILALLGIFLAIALTLPAQLTKLQFSSAVAACIVASAFVLLGADSLFAGFYERLLFKEKYMPGMTFYQTSETKSGVVNVTAAGVVFGGGIYDGKYNLDLVHDSNGIFRAYFLSAVHPDPKDVLIVGFASGSWSEVIANHPQVRSVTIIEINPGYFDLLKKHPLEAAVVENPKVQVVIDDGRRWLVRNPDRKFDMIVMNTTYNWRAHATNLLSADFLRMIRPHLKPGGIHYYNTTESEEVQATGVRVYPYGLRVANFLMLSDSPIKVDKDRWRDSLVKYTLHGRPVFDLSRPEDNQRLEQVLALSDTLNKPTKDFFSLEDAVSIRARTSGVRTITDDNMGTEWGEKAGIW